MNDELTREEYSELVKIFDEWREQREKVLTNIENALTSLVEGVRTMNREWLNGETP